MTELNRKTIHDHRTVDISKPHLVALWIEHFGVTETVLEDAIAAVGNDPDHIECYINKMILYYTHVCCM